MNITTLFISPFPELLFELGVILMASLGIAAMVCLDAKKPMRWITVGVTVFILGLTLCILCVISQLKLHI